MTVSATPNVPRDRNMPAMLLRSNGRRPILSSKNVATRMKIVFTNPTATVASSFLSFEVIPAFAKIQGLYRTTASIPVICWKKWIPTAEIRMCRTAGVGWTNSSFQTPSP